MAQMSATKPKKITISLLDGSDSSGHRFGVSALASTSDACWADGPQLVSAGRDGCVRCWQLPDKARSGAPRLNFSLEEHTDWVNDIALLPDGGCTSGIVSASSDHTIKLWTFAQGGSKARAPVASARAHAVAHGARVFGQAVPRCHTLRRHTDYVKALAYASQARPRSPTPPPRRRPRRRCDERRRRRQVKLLASAGCDGSVILWDVQALAPCGGSGTGEHDPRHSDSIYSLSTNASATLVASGSVDKDVRLWDPREPASHVRLRGHTDVVRGVQLSEDSRWLLSCGSDRTLRLWNIGQRRCELCLAPQAASLFCLAADANWSRVFTGGRDGAVAETSLRSSGGGPTRLVCETGAIVQQLHIPPSATDSVWAATSESELCCWALPAEAGDAGGEAAPLAEKGKRGPPLVGKPRERIGGAAGVRQFAALPSKLQVLTEDSAGNAALWDLTRGVCVQRFPRKEKTREGGPSRFDELQREHAQQQLAVPSWFSLSSRSGALEVTLEPSSCFNAEAYATELGVSADAELRVNLGERLLRALFGAWRGAHPHASAEDGEAPMLPYRDLAQVPMLITEGGVVVLRCTAAQLPHAPPETIPHWVSQAVLHRHFTPREPLKLSFYLAPHASSHLPALPPGASKLSAAKVLKVTKVLAYVAGQLPEHSIGNRPLQLLCNDKLLPADMTLCSVSPPASRPCGGSQRLTPAPCSRALRCRRSFGRTARKTCCSITSSEGSFEAAARAAGARGRTRTLSSAAPARRARSALIARTRPARRELARNLFPHESTLHTQCNVTDRAQQKFAAAHCTNDGSALAALQTSCNAAQRRRAAGSDADGAQERL